MNDMQWISIKDKLPEKDVPVLCFYWGSHMDVMEYWDDDEKGNAIFMRPPAPPNEITHWMPLPQPPQ